MSLIKLAETGKLPLHQNLDKDSLQWIISNKPSGIRDMSTTSINKLVDLNIAAKFVPHESWFTSPQKVNSIHGIRHLMRVTSYAYLLGYVLEKRQLNSLLIATSLHDVRRLNDNADEGHAQRAAHWFTENSDLVLKKYDISSSEVDVTITASLIQFHELLNTELEATPFYQAHSRLVDILKTADALDRYVQPKLKWWPNDSYLKLIPKIELKAFAYNLIVKSERNYIEGTSSMDSVLTALKDDNN